MLYEIIPEKEKYNGSTIDDNISVGTLERINGNAGVCIANCGVIFMTEQIKTQPKF